MNASLVFSILTGPVCKNRQKNPHFMITSCMEEIPGYLLKTLFLHNQTENSFTWMTTSQRLLPSLLMYGSLPEYMFVRLKDNRSSKMIKKILILSFVLETECMCTCLLKGKEQLGSSLDHSKVRPYSIVTIVDNGVEAKPVD